MKTDLSLTKICDGVLDPGSIKTDLFEGAKSLCQKINEIRKQLNSVPKEDEGEASEKQTSADKALDKDKKRQLIDQLIHVAHALESSW